MAQKSNESARKGNLLDDLIQNVQLAWRLMTDPRVSLITKALVPALGLAYVIVPIDLLPDVIPVLGQLDEVAVMLLLVRLFISLAPPAVVAEHRTTMRGGSQATAGGSGQQGGQTRTPEDDVIDAEYRVMDDE
jgi:uncharacterized membrane protein YkvA (DUF1232 family)